VKKRCPLRYVTSCPGHLDLLTDPDRLVCDICRRIFSLAEADALSGTRTPR
jgi:hypothetical protein